MKIWFVEIGEPLPIEGENVRLYRYGMLTQFLASKGHKVIWWTSSFSHAERRFVRDRDTEECVKGVTLKVLNGPGYDRNISLRRFHHQAHFARRFYQAAKNEEPPDIIISPVPTLDITMASIRLAKNFGIPVLTDIRDEWPDELVDLMPKKLRWVMRIALKPMYRQMSYICRNATGIMAISRRQLEYGLKFAGRTKGIDDKLFPLGYASTPVPAEKLQEARLFWKGLGVEGNFFTVCLFSSINNRLNLNTVFESARILEKEFPIQFVLCGSGSGIERAKKNAEGIKSVLLPGWIDGPKISSLMEIAHVGLAPYAADVRMSLPNKPFEYFSGGLPVISSIEGELTEILAEHNCGRSYQANSVDELCNSLRELNAHPELRVQMGRNARHLFEKDFAIEVTFQRIHEHLKSVVARYKESPHHSKLGFFSSLRAGEPTQT